MAGVKLYLLPNNPPHEYRFLRPDGSTGQIEGLRLRAYARLVGMVNTRTPRGINAAFPDCVLDTGAFLTVIPERIWRYFLPGVVTPLPFHPSMPQLHRDLTIAGGAYRYDLGELVIPLRDKEGGSLNVKVVAKLTRDRGLLDIPLILGLRGGVLDGRRLRADPDAAIPHGQSWTLADQ